MKNLHNYILLAGLAICFAVAGISSVAHANPYFFPAGLYTSAATSSPVVIGTAATSSLTYDAYSSSQPLAAENATLLIQATGTTSASLIITFQYSQDGIDWYSDNLFDNGLSTTTVSYNITAPRTYTWSDPTNVRALKALSFTTPTRYTRVNIVAAGASSTVWAQIVPRRQQNQN